MKKSAAIFLLCATLFMQGCLAFAASQLGYFEAKSKYTKLYDNYKSERVKANEPVEKFNDWIKEQPLKSNEIKVFKNNGVISPEDAKEIKKREAEKKKVGK